MATVARRRSPGLDIVRTIACLTVIGSHFFLYTSFKTTVYSGLSMFLQGVLTSIVIGSDLYMILTGFLCANKTIGRNFYLSGIKVLASYIFFSILTIAVKKYLFHEPLGWGTGLMGILSFSTIPYAWYIEMWIGLFIMAPFLNIWYKALPSRRMKISLILILFAFSALPDNLNRYGLYIVPAFWRNIYPVAFYFAGCFVREYRPRLPRRKLLTTLLCVILIGPVLNLFIPYPTFLHFTGTRSGFFMSATAILIFLTFYNVDITSKSATWIFKMISLRSLDIFLCSSIFDAYIYPFFMERYFVDQAQFGKFYLVIVPLIFAGCYIIASVKRWLFDLLQWVLNKCGCSQVAIQNRG